MLISPLFFHYRYVQLEELGNGTYGSVLLGQRVDTGEKVHQMVFTEDGNSLLT